AARICAGSVTSNINGTTRSSAHVSGWRVPAYTRCAPRPSASATSARPRPRLAPVTRIDLPAKVVGLITFGSPDSSVVRIRWLRHPRCRKRTGPFGAGLVSAGDMRVGSESLVGDTDVSEGDLGKARGGDESAFRDLVEPYRRELHL